MATASTPLARLPAHESLSGAVAALQALGDAAWIVDAATFVVLAANRVAIEMLGGGELVGLEAEDVLASLEDLAWWEGARAGYPGMLESDTELLCPGGVSRSVARRIAPMQLADGTALWLVQVRDRSRECSVERDRETALAELRATLEATADAILVTGLDGRVRAFNRRFATLWGLPDAVAHGTDQGLVGEWLRLNVMDVDAYDRRLEEVYAHTLAASRDEIAHVNGALIERQTQPQWSRGRPIGRVFSFRELNPRRACAPRQAGCDGIDQLTKLPNRTGFLKAIEDGLRGDAGVAGFAVLCVEFDRETLFGEGGHGAAGARRLSELAGQVRGAMRQPHHCARLGGSRFGVLIDHASEAVAEAAARRLIEALEHPGGVPAAIGIAVWPGAGLSADEILRHAEIAMYRAQQASRPAFAVHRFGFEARQRRRDRIELGLSQAVAEGRLRVAAQPRCGADGEPQALELALRWRDRELGEVAPPRFLSVAEECGLAGALDDWLLERGLLLARRWRDAGHALRLNVRVCAWQLTRPGYARRVSAALEAAGWVPGELELDVTEAALQSDPDAATAAVRALARQGVRLLLDGLGAGTSSFTLLQRLPLAGVKLAPAIAHQAGGGAAGAHWVSALVSLAHALNLKVHAVGVDTLAQAEILRRAGCDGLQGRRIGVWMEEPALESWLAMAPRRCA